jgi:hypothetical protein
MDYYLAQFFNWCQIGLTSDEVLMLKDYLIALLLVLGGLVAGEIVKYLGTLLLKLARWDRFCERIGAARLLHKFNPGWSATVVAGQVLFWFIFLGFFMKALVVTGLPGVSDVGDAYFHWLPQALGGVLILLAAFWLAAGLGRLALLIFPEPWSGLAAGLLPLVAADLGLFEALQAFGFDRSLVLPIALIVLAGVVLAVALAWGFRRDLISQELRPRIRVPETEEGLKTL